MIFSDSLENHIKVFKNLESHTSNLNVLIEKCTNTLKKGGKVLFVEMVDHLQMLSILLLNSWEDLITIKYHCHLYPFC